MKQFIKELADRLGAFFGWKTASDPPEDEYVPPTAEEIMAKYPTD